MLKYLILTHRWTVRLIAGLTITAFFVVAITILTLRYWLLPNIENYRPRIEAAVSHAIGERIAIGRISANWMGIHPHLVMRDIRIFDRSGRVALSLDRIANNLSWMTFLTGEIRFSSIEIDHPSLAMHRDKNGVIYVAGIPVNQGPSNQSLSDWLLHQSKVLINNGLIEWQDEKSGAPQLTIKAVDFALVNSGEHHLFGLHASPPAELSSPLDIRGNLYGKSLNDFDSWRGKLYAQIDYANTEKLKSWLPSPEQLLGGNGAMRVWLDFSHVQPEAFTADLVLSDVHAKFGNNLPEIDMKRLRGRINWQAQDGGFAIHTQNLSLETMEGERIKPTEFELRAVPAHDISPMEGEMSVNFLDLAMLAKLSEHFPMPSKIREMLTTLAPQGNVSDLQIKWAGTAPASALLPWQSKHKTEADQLPEHYSIKGNFTKLGFNYSGNAFKNFSGRVDGDEKGGSFSIDSRQTQFSLPKVFALPISLDMLTAQAKWHHDDKGLAVSFDNISFSNADFTGNAFGTYNAASRLADLTGKLSRAEANHVWRYLPLVVAQDARDWVRNAIVGGNSNDVKFRLKGAIDDFPFTNGKGIFLTSIHARDATLRYAPGWPEMTSVSADILFKGAMMDITSHQADILGAKLTSVRALIPDLDHPLLDIDGEAVGPTEAFLKFIERSPVTHYINGFTSGMDAAGSGNLKLKLGIPLDKVENTKVSGTYQFMGNKVTTSFMPDIANLDGTLKFSESSLDAKAISATILGGPALINASTGENGSMKITAAGRINPDHIASAFARHFHGSSAWQGMISVGKKTSIQIASSLQGISSDLPYPFGKKVADSLPFRLERKTLQDEDVLSVSLGKILTAEFSGGTEGGFARIDRGTIQLNDDARIALPEAPGIWLVGSLKSLDVDRWRDILDEMGSGQPPLSLSGIDLDIDSLVFLGKQFGQLYISAKQTGGNWQANLSGNDIEGSATWIPVGKGRLVAKLRKLIIPYEKEAVEPKAALAKASNRNLPALDVTADSFVMKNKHAGRLELVAVQQGNDWKIQKLRISNSDSVLTADGIWQGWAIHPRTNINVKLDVSRIGKFLVRFGYPDNIMRGRGSMEGTLSWAGSPQSINYASLNGNIVLKARHGQFNKIDPGIGKFLGILSLQALPRRITLDFRDIFSKGFVFDDISSSLNISDGIARTNDLRIVGPAAEVGMKGSIDLDKETQDLNIVVRPQIGSSVSIASSLLGGPVVGIATWVVGKVLQDPLDQLASYEYNVTGSWIDPIVTKVHE